MIRKSSVSMLRCVRAAPFVAAVLAFALAVSGERSKPQTRIRLPSACNQTSGMVCAEGKRIYDSECAAIAAGAQVLHFGECESGAEQALRCPLYCRCPDPVCGEDMVTYWCGSEAARCAGVAVAHEGLCPEGNTGFSVAPRAAQTLLLLHLVWLGGAVIMILGGVI